MRFEHHVRIFIDEAMTKAFGQNWTKQRISGPMSNAWQEKKAKGLASGDADLPLIAYADFTDYMQILIQNNNWKEVFEAYFRHKPSVQESFRRLFPVRICVMHSRTISQDDSLFLLVEIKRLASAMGFAV